MADSIEGLGTAPLWRATINWRDVPKYDYEIPRRVVNFDGTATALFTLASAEPQQLEFLVTARNKQQEFDLISQFATFQGRHKRFWLLLPMRMFKLVGSQGIGTQIVAEFDGFVSRGFERLYWLTVDNDLITREVTGHTTDEGAGTQTFTLGTATDRVLDPNDIVLFSLAILCRLDQDTLEMDWQSDAVSETTVKVFELVEEYDDV